MIAKLQPRQLWWVALGVVLLIAALPRLSTFNYSLPYVDYVDEPNFYVYAQEWRNNLNWSTPKGYPPGLLLISMATQTILDAGGHGGMASTIYVLRLLTVILDLLTIVFVALTARAIGGNLGGVVAGLAWAITPTFLANAVYATGDPGASLFAVVALCLAVAAATDLRHRAWCVWSVAAGLVAALFKYPAVVAVIPGGLVALYTLFRSPRIGTRYLAIQGMLVLIVAVFLVDVYGMTKAGEPGGLGGGINTRFRQLSTYIRIDATLRNLSLSISSVDSQVFVIVVGLASVAFIATYAFSWRRVNSGPLVLCLILLVLGCWISTTFDSSPDAGNRIRDLFPAMSVVCIIFGVATTQLAWLLSQKWWLLARFGVVAVILVRVFLPQLVADAAIMRDRQRPDTRVMIRQWADASLDPGWVLVAHDNYRTFNWIFSGIPEVKRFDWWETPNMTSESPASWRDNHGFTYIAIPKDQLLDLQSKESGRAFLAQLLHLRDFISEAEWRGPEDAVYRLWPVQVQTNIRFGDSISLAGYDHSAEYVRPGDSIKLRLYWQAAKQPPVNYSLYVHLSSASVHDALAQFDGSPGMPERPTSSWDAANETLMSNPIQLQIPADLPTGQYRLLVGLYDAATGQRLMTPAGQDYSKLFEVNVLSEF